MAFGFDQCDSCDVFMIKQFQFIHKNLFFVTHRARDLVKLRALRRFFLLRLFAFPCGKNKYGSDLTITTRPVCIDCPQKNQKLRDLALFKHFLK